MSIRRMLPFIFINIVVSATVVLLVLYWWDSRRPEEVATQPVLAVEAGETPVAQLPTAPAAVESAVDDAATTAPEEGTEDGPTIHVVQTGETLGRISELYDVPIADIAEANNIVNVNSLAVGQELIIPIGGFVTATPAATETPEAVPTPLPTEPPAAGTAILEIAEVIGIGELTEEAVRITNAGTRPLALRDWQLLDEDGHIYTFVGVTLFGSSAAGSPSILIHTETGENGPSDLYWGQETAVWEPGETVTVQDAEGTTQATYVIPEGG